MSKKVILFSSLVIVLIGFLTVYPTLFQKGNPIPIMKGIIKLNTSDYDMIKISDEPERYI